MVSYRGIITKRNMLHHHNWTRNIVQEVRSRERKPTAPSCVAAHPSSERLSLYALACL